MAASTTPNNTLKQRFSTLLGIDPRALKETVKDLPRVVGEVPQTIEEAARSAIAPLSVENISSMVVPKQAPMGHLYYADTDTQFGRDVEPFNLNVMARIEGGDKVLNLKHPHLFTHPVSGATGRYQIKPALHSDIGNLRWYGATPLKKPQDYDTEEKQRAHANRYLTALLGKYEDKYSNTDTRKFKDKYGQDDFGKDSKNRWSKNKKQYMPRHDVKGARATALAAYNLGPTSMDYMLDNNKKLTGKGFAYKHGKKQIPVTNAKLAEVRGYLGRYVAEGELTAQEVIDAFPDMKGKIEKEVIAWRKTQRSRKVR